MKLPPFKILLPISVEFDRRTNEAILTCVVDTGLPPPGGSIPPVILYLTPSVRTALIVSLRAIEIAQENPSEAPNKPDFLQ